MKTSTVSKKAPIQSKKPELKKSSKLTSWPRNPEERKALYYKYSSGRERLSYQFLELMIKGEDIFKGVTKPVLKRAYIKADEVGDNKSEGLITRKEFPYFLKYLLYFTDLWKAFDRIDEAKKGRLSLDDFVKNRAILDPKMTKPKAIDLFKQMDKDGGGAISFDEFCNWGLEQATILQYDNKEFFSTDITLQDVEENEEVTKGSEQEETKEEPILHESTEDLVEKEGEINGLKAKIQELKEEIMELHGKKLVGVSGDEKLLEELKEIEKKSDKLYNFHGKLHLKMQKLKTLNGKIENKILKSSGDPNLKEELLKLRGLTGDLEKKLIDCSCGSAKLKDSLQRIKTIHGNIDKKRSESIGETEYLAKFRLLHEEIHKKITDSSMEHTNLLEEFKRMKVLNREISKKLKGPVHLRAKLQKLRSSNDELTKKIEKLSASHGKLQGKLMKLKGSSEDPQNLKTLAEDLEKKLRDCLCGKADLRLELTKMKTLSDDLEYNKSTQESMGDNELAEELRKLKLFQREIHRKMNETREKHDTFKGELKKVKALKRQFSNKSKENPKGREELKKLKGLDWEFEVKLLESSSFDAILRGKFQKIKALEKKFSENGPDQQKLNDFIAEIDRKLIDLSVKNAGLKEELQGLKALREGFKGKLAEPGNLALELMKLKTLYGELGRKVAEFSNGHRDLKEDLRKLKDLYRHLERKSMDKGPFKEENIEKAAKSFDLLEKQLKEAENREFVLKSAES